MSAERRAELHAALDRFLDDESTRPSDVDYLEQYLNARPPEVVIPPLHGLLPPDDVAERLQLAKEIEEQWKAVMPNRPSRRRLTEFQLSTVLNLPLEDLRAERNRATSHDPALISFFTHFEVFVRIFLQMRTIDAGGDAPVSDFTRKVSEKNIPRNAAEAKKASTSYCRERDGGACILLGTANPQVCHIFPFSGNANKYKAERLFAATNVVYSIAKDNALLLTNNDLGSTDKAWNMLSLNPQLHKWWADGYFALKCLGVTPLAHGQPDASVTLQFHWMPLQRIQAAQKSMDQTRNEAWRDEVPLDEGGGEAFVQAWQERARYGAPLAPSSEPAADGGLMLASRAATGRLLHSGATFRVQLPTPDAYMMKAMLDVQWACLNVACMSGAAGSPSFLEDDYDDFYFGAVEVEED